MYKTYMHPTIIYCWEKLKKDQIYEEIHHINGAEDSIWLKCQSPQIHPQIWHNPNQCSLVSVPQAKSENLSTRGDDGVAPRQRWKPENQELWCLSPRRKKANPSFLCLSVLFRFSMNWMTSTHVDEGKSLHWIY